MTKADRLFDMACALADDDPDFHAVQGPGRGNRRNNEFVRALQQRAEATFGTPLHEYVCCDETDLRADYYFRDEATFVEVALGLPNPNTEFEKDILKALVARKPDCRIEKLIFISRPGAKKKCAQPGRSAMIAWAEETQQLAIEIKELNGVARKRIRQSRAARSRTKAGAGSG